jgi:ABC-type microcin C transport system permease subunit YejB
MLSYIFRRLFMTVPVMLFVALFVFGLLDLAPGDPAALLAGEDAAPQDIARIRMTLGLDASVSGGAHTFRTASVTLRPSVIPADVDVRHRPLRDRHRFEYWLAQEWR